ncbi:phenylalanyl-tRNA synthetase alpha subunit [Neolewinella xylanilytica]|uniref:Phenylalanine--tRNA ligase alpha subunit n=1 Tax=Neolewinella xylanilytica TaxID=1514080 RepID=A0A2S6I4K2_9BACT|nr:phenylalanine--tRNA ligase subunit alpha [Neolewinella xylanilytica]PPK86097.1 phenylalanyl-tRNA synthetase alpha subunit [Neolewinella xylanilytica]
MDVFERVAQLIEEIDAVTASTPEQVEAFRIRYLGSKNILRPLMGEMRTIPNERKPDFGQLVNRAKQHAQDKFDGLQAALASQESATAGSELDLTAPAEPMPLGSRHPIALTMRRIVSIFERIGFAVAEGPEIEDDWHNFSAMNTPEDHPARDMQDTFYTGADMPAGPNNSAMLLRTHTSSVQARTMEAQQPPIRIIAPGRVYRNETISARSHAQFHQVEGLYIAERVSFADMKATLLHFAREMYGEKTKIRLRPSYFPFTEPSAEMDIWWGLETEHDHRITKGTGWLEILGCGMVDPAVLENCGIDPERYTGYAFGMGIERQAMLLYNITDIRLMFENDVRFLRQFASVV